ncbi:hypothetical protein GCM10020000_01500 [Streptomyces olivoverticillatus]
MNEQSVVGEPSGVPERARTEESGGGWPGSDGDRSGGPDGAPPRRAAAWWVKRGLPPVALLAVIFAGVQGVRPLPDPALALDRSAAFTFGGGEFAVPWPGQGQAAAMVVGVGSLGRSGGQRPVPTASVAKVMTAYVILKGHPLRKDEQGPQITVDAKAEEESKSPDESTVPLRSGQRFTERQMLQMLLIPSSNNAARQLARWDAGSEDAFAKKMNAAAGELGMTQTTYTDPSGFMESTKSTAVDQLKLAEEVMKADAFRQIVRMTSAEIPGLPKTIYNSNELLTRQSGMARHQDRLDHARGRRADVGGLSHGRRPGSADPRRDDGPARRGRRPQGPPQTGAGGQPEGDRGGEVRPDLGRRGAEGAGRRLCRRRPGQQDAGRGDRGPQGVRMARPGAEPAHRPRG